jgi:hypothetical protein
MALIRAERLVKTYRSGEVEVPAAGYREVQG